MLRYVTDVGPARGYKLWLRFDDGVEGEIDLGPLLTFDGIFAPLRDAAYFAQVRVETELGTGAWLHGVDWDSLFLYSLVTGREVNELLAEGASAGR